MIDHALTVRPRRERGRQRIVGITLHRAFQQVQRVRIALGVERKHAGHRPQRHVVRAQIGLRFAAGALDFGKAQAWLHRRDDLGGQMLVDSGVVTKRAIGTMRRQMTAGFGVDQPEGQACFPVRSADGADQMIARRAGLPDDSGAGPRQSDRKLIGDAVRDVAVFRAGVDRAQRHGRPIAAWESKTTASMSVHRRRRPAASRSATAFRQNGGDTRSENRPQCGNPQRRATSITLASGMPCSKSRRAFSNRTSRRAARGVLPRNSRNCRCSVRLDSPAVSASSVTVQSRPTFVRIASSARRTPRGSRGVLEALLGHAFMEDSPAI